MSLSNLFKCAIEGDSSWFHLMVGTPNQLVSLKVRSRVTQRCPRAVYRRERQGGYDRRYWRAWPLLVSRESYQNHESRALPRVTRDKVRRRFTLSVTAESWWDDRVGTDVTGGPDCCRCPRL